MTPQVAAEIAESRLWSGRDGNNLAKLILPAAGCRDSSKCEEVDYGHSLASPAVPIRDRDGECARCAFSNLPLTFSKHKQGKLNCFAKSGKYSYSLPIIPSSRTLSLSALGTSTQVPLLTEV
jgi:hypothetical protein